MKSWGPSSRLAMRCCRPRPRPAGSASAAGADAPDRRRGPRDVGAADPRVLFSQQLWRTDSPEAATGLLEAGRGWDWLPRSLVAAQLAAGTLCVLPSRGLTNALALCVDVVWSTERPMGLGARLLVEGVRRARA